MGGDARVSELTRCSAADRPRGARRGRQRREISLSGLRRGNCGRGFQEREAGIPGPRELMAGESMGMMAPCLTTSASLVGESGAGDFRWLLE